MKANLSKLYLLGEAFERGSVRAKITCQLDDGDIVQLISGNCSCAISLKQVEGKKLCDLMGTTATLTLISSRVADALKMEGITGLATCPAGLRNRKGETIPGYEVLATTGRCGPLVNSRSPKVTRTNYARTGSMDVWLGYYFDEETWDGSDMFRPEGTRMTIVTERVKELIESINGTNIDFKAILDVERLVL